MGDGESSVQNNVDDQLIIEGYPLVDAKRGVGGAGEYLLKCADGARRTRGRFLLISADINKNDTATD